MARAIVVVRAAGLAFAARGHADVTSRRRSAERSSVPGVRLGGGAPSESRGASADAEGYGGQGGRAAWRLDGATW